MAWKSGEGSCRSRTVVVAPASASSAAEVRPVETASTGTPAARPAAASAGVSPVSKTSVRATSAPVPARVRAMAIATLVRLAGTLGVSVSALMDGPTEDHVRVVSASTVMPLWAGERGSEARLMLTALGPAPVKVLASRARRGVPQPPSSGRRRGDCQRRRRSHGPGRRRYGAPRRRRADRHVRRRRPPMSRGEPCHLIMTVHLPPGPASAAWAGPGRGPGWQSRMTGCNFSGSGSNRGGRHTQPSGCRPRRRWILNAPVGHARPRPAHAPSWQSNGLPSLVRWATLARSPGPTDAGAASAFAGIGHSWVAVPDVGDANRVRFPWVGQEA